MISYSQAKGPYPAAAERFAASFQQSGIIGGDGQRFRLTVGLFTT
jgi:hypothetical protein